MNKNEFFEEKRKPTLKEKVVRGMATILVVTAIFPGFFACRNKNQETPAKTDYPTTQSDVITNVEETTRPAEQTQPTEDTTENGGNVDPTPAEVPTQQIEAFKTSLQNKNFTFETENATYLVANNTYEKIESNNNAKIYATEDGINFEYSFDATENKWTKDFSEVSTDYFSQISPYFENVTWSSYDPQTGVIGGNIGSNEIALVLTQNGAQITSGNDTISISNVGSTTIEIPQTYIDNTIENNDIYSVDEQGNYDFNLVLMKEVLLDWMKGNNQYNKEIFTEVTASNDVETKDIVFIEASASSIKVSFLAHWKSDDALTLESMTIIDRDLYSAIQSQTIKTKDEFSTHLYNMKRNRVSKGDYITIDTSLSKSDFETITTNIFIHLVNVGTQSLSINEEGVKHPEFADAKVLFGFSDKGGDSIGYDLGQTWTQRFYYLIELNGQIELLKVGVVCEQNINRLINDTPNKWLIRDDQLNELERMDVKNKEVLPEEKYITSENNYQKEMEL